MGLKKMVENLLKPDMSNERIKRIIYAEKLYISTRYNPSAKKVSDKIINQSGGLVIRV